ncbi:MAG: class II aldolase/adducin family protein [Deltaproteobacteria bacterium]
MSSVIELKKKLIQAAAICEMEGLCGPFGHVSARIPERNLIMMTPSGPPGGARLSNIVTLNLKGEKIRGGGKPNRELPIHTSIYRVRDDVQSVVHVHPPKVIAFSVAGKEIFPMSFEDRRFFPSVRIFGEPDEEVYIDSDELGERMAQVLGKDNVLIIRGHGVVTVGDSIEAACIHAVALEKTAEIQYMASMLLLSQSVKGDFKTAKLFDRDGADIKTRLQKRQWDFYLSKLNGYLNKGK